MDVRQTFTNTLSKKLGIKNAIAYEEKLFSIVGVQTFPTLYYEILGRLMESKTQDDRKTIMANVREGKIVTAMDEYEFRRYLANDRLVRPPKVSKGAHRCKKCRSEETVGYGLQTRSGDEGMTFFITCVKCNHRWRE
uniref:TFIIS-type domain-containing protein n=1 Tax=viral metagenome TaxID=1070528 RepID=A0A6C0LXK1_9ZZZZ